MRRQFQGGGRLGSRGFSSTKGGLFGVEGLHRPEQLIEMANQVYPEPKIPRNRVNISGGRIFSFWGGC